MPAADHRHGGASAEFPLLIDEIHQSFRIVRQQHRDDRADDEPRRREHQHDAHQHEQQPRDGRDDIVIAALPQVDCAENRFLDQIQILIVEYQRKPQTDQQNAHGEKPHPALEFHAGIQPFE